jgi:5'-methylthioadenosine phosphorylase
MIGIIGGTGLYALPGLVEDEWRRVESPFGEPSDALLFGRLGEHRIVFLPRHGRGHRIPPHEIPFRANIDALKRAGATSLLSLSAVGSLRAELAPGAFVLVDQFIDRTLRGPKTFFGTGCVAHVSMAHPTCARMRGELAAAGAALGLSVVSGGTYVAMEGPQFSSSAESEMHRMLGASVVGMTNMPEAKLAREAELCYATLALVTDYDVWHEEHDAVTVEAVVANLMKNVATAKEVLRRAIPLIPESCEHGCPEALRSAVLTDPSAFPPRARKKLALLLDRQFPVKAGARSRG